MPDMFLASIATTLFSFVNMPPDAVFIVVHRGEQRANEPMVFPNDSPKRVKAKCKVLSLKSRSSGARNQVRRDHSDNK